MKAKIALGVVVALLVAVGGGWLWGASGRWVAERELRAAELKIDLLEGHGFLLDARLDVYDVNFGDASRSLEDAKGRLRSAEARVGALELEEDRKRLELALTTIDDAQRLAGQLDQTANSRAADAAALVAALLTGGTGR